MNYVDCIILIVVGGFTIKGLLKGFVKEVGGVVGLILAFTIAATQIGTGAEFLQSAFKINPGISYIFGFVAIFIIVLLAVKIVENILLKIFQITSTVWIDKIGGGVFGFLFGYLIIAVIIVLLSIVPFSETIKKEQNSSKLYPYAEYFSRPLFNFALKINPGAKKINSILKKQIKDKIPDIKLDNLNK